MKRKLCELALTAFLYALQCTACRAVAIGGITPNLLVILPVLFGYLKGKSEGIYVGLICGIFYDLFTYDLVGLSSIAMMYIGYFSGYFYQKYEETEILISIGHVDILYYLKRFVIPEVVYTVIVTILIYRIIVFLNKHFEGRKRKRAIEYDQGNI